MKKYWIILDFQVDRGSVCVVFEFDTKLQQSLGVLGSRSHAPHNTGEGDFFSLHFFIFWRGTRFMLLRGKDVEKSYKGNTSALMLSDSPGKVQKV